jgi:hypothetical protein
MFVNEIFRNPISDTLEAQNRHEPIKEPGGIVIIDGDEHAVVAQVSSEIVDI